jgi:gamma-glutamyltranspeptidase/glutathione hydrolase
VLEQDPPLPWPLPLDQLQTNDQPARLQRVGSGTALVQRINGYWHGAADPRREGTALAIDDLNSRHSRCQPQALKPDH